MVASVVVGRASFRVVNVLPDAARFLHGAMLAEWGGMSRTILHLFYSTVRRGGERESGNAELLGVYTPIRPNVRSTNPCAGVAINML